MTDEVFCARVVDDAVAHFGAVHGLVNNAGITRPAMIEKMTVPQWQAVIDVNLTAVHLMQQAVGRHMISRARAGETSPGAIVNISSTAGKRGSIGQVNYAAAKAGVLGITMTGALEWARYGMRVNSVGFGTVETPMTETVLLRPLPRTHAGAHPARPHRDAGRGGAADLLPAVGRVLLRHRPELARGWRQHHACLGDAGACRADRGGPDPLFCDPQTAGGRHPPALPSRLGLTARGVESGMGAVALCARGSRRAVIRCFVTLRRRAAGIRRPCLRALD